MNDNKNIKIFVWIIGILILGTIATVLIQSRNSTPPGPGKYDAFAT